MILDKNKIEEAAKKFSNNGSWQCPVSFEAGISYAESQLSELAIEFAEWIDKYGYVKEDGLDEWYYWDGIKQLNTTYTSKELFKEFLKYKNEKS